MSLTETLIVCFGSGVDEIKSHPFFNGIDWDTLYEQPAPFVPNTDGYGDTRSEEFVLAGTAST